MIRTYQPSDATKLSEMYAEFEPKGFAMGLPPANVCRREDWLQSLTKGEQLVACEGERIVGHVAIMPTGAPSTGTGCHGHSAEVAVFVHQKFRGRDIGAALVGATLERAKDMGVRHLWAYTSAFNTAANATFKKQGFRRFPQRDGMGEVIFARPVPQRTGAIAQVA